MGDQNHPSTTITWRITGFTRLTEREYFSDMILVDGTKWRVMLYPKGNRTNHLSILLELAESDTLPSGWKRKVHFSLTVVNQHDNNLSRTKATETTFTSQQMNWGFRKFISLRELHDISRGFLVDDTLMVEAMVEIRSTHPSIISTGISSVGAASTSTNRFDTYFGSLGEFIINASTVMKEETVAQENMINFETPSPNFEEVEQAKQSLKECLIDPFKLNMKEKLAKALLTLSLSQDGLSPDQRKTVISFWENFDEFTSDLLTFERDNSECELQKLSKDQIFMAIKKNHKVHLSFKQLHSELSEEEEEFKKRLEDVRSIMSNLMAVWDFLLVESERLKFNYEAQEKKVADAEERKKIAEEGMSRITTAWANLKKHFEFEELEG